MQYRHEIKEKTEAYRGPRPNMPESAIWLYPVMRGYLEHRELSFRLAYENGWYPAMYKGVPRIIIPCSNSEGVPYFQGRAMVNIELRYASPSATRDDSIVLCWPVKAKGCVIVEGPMDALAAAEAGYLGIGIMGNQPNDAVLSHVATYARAFGEVRVLPDADALVFGARVAAGLAQRGMLCFIIEPQAKDLAAMSRLDRMELLHG